MIKRFQYAGLVAVILLSCNCSSSGNAENKDAKPVDTGMAVEDGSVVAVEDTNVMAPEDGAAPAGQATSGETEAAEPQQQQATQPENGGAKKGPVDGVARLKAAYPDKIKDIKDNTIYFVDGTTMVYDDGKQKDFVYMLDNSDPEDMFHDPYDTSAAVPGYLQDVGRSRSEQLFKKLYGATSQAVQNQLVSVPWFGGSVRFSSSNGAAEQLKKVKAELDELVKKNPGLKPYLKSSGTFYWRNVRGANRLSAHSYGIAFDIGVDKSDYWLWKNKGASETKKITYHNRIPLEIVEVFEKYGFVWGGRWYHFDTMHFEYRPELNPPTK